MSISRIAIDSLLPALADHRLILAPNHLTANAILQTWSAQQRERSWLQPRVMPVDIWLRELWDQLASQGCAPFAQQRLLHTSQEKLIWTRIIEHDEAASPLLHTGATARLASQAYQLARQWLVTPERQQDLVHSHHIPDVGVFLRWKREFEAFCQTHQLSSLADAIPLLLQALEQGHVALDDSPLLVNFLEPPPLYSMLFNWMRDHWQAQRVQTWPNAESPPSANSPGESARRYCFVQSSDEMAAVVQWAASLLSEQPDVHIGIIASDGSLRAEPLDNALRRRLDPLSAAELGDRHRHVNTFSAQQPLSQSALVDHGLRLLGLNYDTQDILDLLDLLRSPYLHCDDSALVRDASCVGLEDRLRRRGESRVGMAEVRRLLADTNPSTACPSLAERLLRFDQAHREHRHRSLARHWADLFSIQLDILGWPGALHSNTERQALQGWQSALHSLRQASDWLGDLTLSAALAALRQLLMEDSLKPSPDLRCQISLLTPSEASGLRFDHLWIVDMDDDHWPKHSSAQPLLPYRLQKTLGMPGTDPAADFCQAEDLLSGLQQATSGQWVASHVSQDGERKLRASPLVKSLAIHPLPTIDKATHWSSVITAPSLNTVVDVSLLPLQALETPKGGARLLTNQILCPFRAFAEHRLQCQPLQTPVSGLPPAARGKAVHLALQHFYEAIPEHTSLTALTAEALTQHIDTACREALKWLKRQHPYTMTPRFSRVELAYLTRLLQSFLELEQQRPPFSIAATEQPLRFTVGDLDLSLKIDRIDRLEDGSLLLIDYKTGAYISTQMWSDTQPDDLQLPLYVTAVAATSESRVSGAVIARLRADSLGYRGITAEGWPKLVKNDPPWHTLLASWPTVVAATAQQFVDGDITVKPLKGPQTCRNCGRQSLCRIGESASETEQDDDEHSSDTGAVDL